MGGIEALTDRTAQRDVAEMHRNPFEPQAELLDCTSPSLVAVFLRLFASQD